MKSFLFVILFFVGCSGASATKGVYPINQACALVGCFAGDNAGFPVTITHSGSYRLTGNLDLTNSADPGNATGITIGTTPGARGNVTLDLNGFSILGAITCTGTPVTSCSVTTGSGIGIDSKAGSVTIRNGHVSGMHIGIFCFGNCMIENVDASANAVYGFFTGNNLSIIDHCTAERNGGTGLWSTGNIRNSAAFGNAGYGIAVQSGAALNNVVRRNGGHGINCMNCLVRDNVSQYNVGSGVWLNGSWSAWGGNQLQSNTGGNVIGTGVTLAPNSCDGSVCS